MLSQIIFTDKDDHTVGNENGVSEVARVEVPDLCTQELASFFSQPISDLDYSNMTGIDLLDFEHISQNTNHL